MSSFSSFRPSKWSQPFLAEFIITAGLLALATVGFFWQIVFTPSTWQPAGGGDLAPFLYPNYHFAAQYLRQGIIPLWNPHLYSGAPFAADIQSGLFYPINLLVFLLIPELTYEWLEYLAIFHFWLAGATMYLCLRLLRPPTADRRPPAHSTPSSVIGQIADLQSATELTRSPDFSLDSHSDPRPPTPITPLAAFAGALAFEFSDLFIVHFGNLNMIAVAAWLPLIFLLFHRSLSQKSLGLAAASGAVLAIATLAGHIQITLFILLTLGLYTLWDLRFAICDLRFWIFSKPNNLKTANHQSNLQSPISNLQSPIPNPKSPSSIFHPLSSLLLTLLVTIGLSALLLFPAYEMSRYTPRAELPYEEAARYSLPPAQLIGLLVPNYFGRDPALHWGPWERVETGYIGIMTMLLALIGMLFYPGGRLKSFFVGLGLIALLLAMGGYTILHGWLYALVPGFDQLRAPARFILLLDFSLAALAAFGLNYLLRPLDAAGKTRLGQLLKILGWSLGGLIVVAAPLSYFALLVTQDRNPAIFNRAAGAATGVTTFAFFAIAALLVLYLVHSRWLREGLAGVAVIALIGLDLFTLGYNVDVGHTSPVKGFDHPAALAFLQADPSLYRIEVTTDVWHAWQPNTALLHGLDDVWGLYNPLTLADTTLYWAGAPPRNTGRYNFLGAKYIIASKAGAPADGNIVPVFDGDPDINIYLNQDALARVLFVSQAIVVPNHDAAWRATRAGDFDPATTVILEENQSSPSSPPRLLASSPPASASLAILQYDLHTVTVAVETNQPGYLVLPDAYYPGWQATVDDQPEPIWRANYAFRAVYVPAGQHTVQFVFDPLIWKVGLAVSGMTLLGLLGWVGWGWWNHG
ncbi:MAG: YfhO family protein [Chloroflexi bacterium]|nr:YfhO family protein [Chloroflexota bacterium]